MSVRETVKTLLRAKPQVRKVMKVMSVRETVYKTQLRAKLRGRHFTIISNNCWGAHIYQELGIAYETPFVGLFFDPESYLNLLCRFRSAISNPLIFIDASQHPAINDFRAQYGRAYPIARLDDDIEIQFLHSHTEAEASEKWTRRIARIQADDNKLFLKFCDHDQPTRSQLEVFDRLPFENKVCFVANNYPELKNAIHIPACHEGFVPHGAALQRLVRPYFDVADWLRGGTGKPKWYSLGCRLYFRKGN